MKKKLTLCDKCHKKILETSLYCSHCGIEFPADENRYSIKRGVSPLKGLKNGSIAIIISVIIFSLMMWGVIELFSAIADAFHF